MRPKKLNLTWTRFEISEKRFRVLWYIVFGHNPPKSKRRHHYPSRYDCNQRFVFNILQMLILVLSIKGSQKISKSSSDKNIRIASMRPCVTLLTYLLSFHCQYSSHITHRSTFHRSKLEKIRFYPSGCREPIDWRMKTLHLASFSEDIYVYEFMGGLPA